MRRPHPIISCLITLGYFRERYSCIKVVDILPYGNAKPLIKTSIYFDVLGRVPYLISYGKSKALYYNISNIDNANYYIKQYTYKQNISSS